MMMKAELLNNLGASSLLDGKSKEAYRSFKEALNVIRDFSAEVLDPNAAASTDKHKVNYKPDLGKAMICSQMPVPGFPSTDFEDGFHVFNGVLDVRFRTTGDSVKDASMLSAIIVFNLSLIYHQRGIEAHDSTKLQKAVVLYSRCMHLSESALCWTSNDDSRLLRLAALNNILHIQKRIGVPALKDTYKLLCETVPDVTARPWKRNSEKLIDEIILNVLAFGFVMGAAAA